MLPIVLYGWLVFVLADDPSEPITINNHWPGGMDTTFYLNPTKEYNGWCARIVFDQPVNAIQTWRVLLVKTCGCNSEFIVKNKYYEVIKKDDRQIISMNVNTSCVNPINGRTYLTDDCQTCYITGCPAANASCNATSTTPTLTTTKNIRSSASLSMTSSQGQVTSAGNVPPRTGYTQTQENTTAVPNYTVQTGQNVTNSAQSGQISGHPAANVTGSGKISPNGTKYNYGEALRLSIRFYNAQRSGKLPPNNPIPWRGDSAVNDSHNGIDLSGGWYNGGYHMKFNFPMSSSATNLLWGLEKWKNAYNRSGQLDEMYDMIRWPLEYFLKCWRSNQKEYYVQVGEGPTDHHHWVLPENMHFWRPAYKVDTTKPGSDVAGETAASLAAGAIVFKNKDSNFSSHLLDAAKSLYKFAKDYRGLYSHSVPEAAIYYGSDNYTDELCEAAAWLYKATNDTRYLADAKSFYVPGVPKALHWGDKHVSCQMLLYEVTKEERYKHDVEMFVKANMPGNHTYTPCGLDFVNQWGSLRYAANVAFVALLAAENGIGDDQYKAWAMSQINYILGDNNKNISYEIGFGSKYPQHPHHSGSTRSKNVLEGALVGGPDNKDNYEDRLDNYQNSVALDYNAGYQSALAALVHFANKGQLPVPPPAKC